MLARGLASVTPNPSIFWFNPGAELESQWMESKKSNAKLLPKPVKNMRNDLSMLPLLLSESEDDIFIYTCMSIISPSPVLIDSKYTHILISNYIDLTANPEIVFSGAISMIHKTNLRIYHK